jgi:hypothetical protein
MGGCGRCQGLEVESSGALGLLGSPITANTPNLFYEFGWRVNSKLSNRVEERVEVGINCGGGCGIEGVSYSYMLGGGVAGASEPMRSRRKQGGGKEA